MCPLEEVVVSGVSGLTDRSVFALANCCCSTLKEVYASGCSMITQAAINYLKVLKHGIFFFFDVVTCVGQSIFRFQKEGEMNDHFVPY